MKRFLFFIFLFLNLKPYDKDFLASILLIFNETEGTVLEIGSQELNTRAIHSFLLGKMRHFYSVNFDAKKHDSLRDLSNNWHYFSVNSNPISEVLKVLEKEKIDVLIVDRYVPFFKELNLNLVRKKVCAIISKEPDSFAFLKEFKFWDEVNIYGPSIFASDIIDIKSLLLA